MATHAETLNKGRGAGVKMRPCPGVLTCRDTRRGHDGTLNLHTCSTCGNTVGVLNDQVVADCFDPTWAMSFEGIGGGQANGDWYGFDGGNGVDDCDLTAIASLPA